MAIEELTVMTFRYRVPLCAIRTKSSGSRALALTGMTGPSRGVVGARYTRIQRRWKAASSRSCSLQRAPAPAGHIESYAISRLPSPTPQGPPVALPSLLLRGQSGRTPLPQRPSRRHQQHAKHGMTPIAPGTPWGRTRHGRLVRRRPTYTPAAAHLVGSSHAPKACLGAHDPAARYDLTACSRVAASMMPRRRISTLLA